MRYLCGLGIVCIIILCNCKVKQSQLYPEDRKLVDSVYKMSIDSVRELVDSLCAQLNEEFYDQAIDSIILERIKEIESIRK